MSNTTSGNIWGGAYDAVLRKTEFDEAEHPRVPAGSEHGYIFNSEIKAFRDEIEKKALDIFGIEKVWWG